MALPTTAGWYEVASNGTFAPLTLGGETKADGTLTPTRVADPGEIVYPISVPSAPTGFALIGSPGTTSANFSWTAPTTGGTVSGYRLYIGSKQNGTNLSSTALTGTATGLTANTAYTASVTAYSSTGESPHSNQITFTTKAVVTGVPSAPTSLTASNIVDTSMTLSWAETTDATVTKHTLYKNGVAQTTAIGATATTLSVTGLTAGTSYSFYVTRSNSSGESSPSNSITKTTTGGTATNMWMGTSLQQTSPGGYSQWNAVRCYRFSAGNSAAGTNSPVVLALSDDVNAPVTGGSTTANTVDTQLRSIFKNHPGIEIHYANGNEIDRKGPNMTDYLNTMKALRTVFDGLVKDGFKASLWIDLTAQNTRSGSNTNFKVVAPYLDGVACSLYPPGRNTSPVQYNYFSFFLDPVINLVLDWGVNQISGWETGIPADTNHAQKRPAYAAAMAQYLQDNSVAAGLKPREFIWWDNMLSGGPDNKFLDEPSTANPSTATAWRQHTAAQVQYWYNNFTFDGNQ